MKGAMIWPVHIAHPIEQVLKNRNGRAGDSVEAMIGLVSK